eukprot:94573_1
MESCFEIEVESLDMALDQKIVYLIIMGLFASKSSSDDALEHDVDRDLESQPISPDVKRRPTTPFDSWTAKHLSVLTVALILLLIPFVYNATLDYFRESGMTPTLLPQVLEQLPTRDSIKSHMFIYGFALVPKSGDRIDDKKAVTVLVNNKFQNQPEFVMYRLGSYVHVFVDGTTETHMVCAIRVPVQSNELPKFTDMERSAHWELRTRLLQYIYSRDSAVYDP